MMGFMRELILSFIYDPLIPQICKLTQPLYYQRTNPTTLIKIHTHKIEKIIINANAPNYCEKKYEKCM